MKIAHAVKITPRRCGLYETTREIVKALRNVGYDSRLVEVGADNDLTVSVEDRGVPVADMDWGVQSDLIISHSGYETTPLGKSSQPIIHVAHGRPKSSYLTEQRRGTPIYSHYYQRNNHERWKAVVTLWKEHRLYWEVMFPDKPVCWVPACVDLDEWNPNGSAGYNFKGRAGRINVISTDRFWDDLDPFESVNAFALWARTVEGAKLHIYAKPRKAPAFDAVLKRIRDDGNLGEVNGWITAGMDILYRSADFLITSHETDTRAVREAMACGCPVVKLKSASDWVMLNKPIMDRDHARSLASKMFNPARTARAFTEIIERIR